MRLNVLNRKVHYWAAFLAALPVIVIILTGLLLQLKKHWTFVQPAEQRGTGTSPAIGLEDILVSVKGVSELGVTSWDDVNRLDLRPGRGVVKVWMNSGWEAQVDLGTGQVLQTAYRRSDLIESIHDGSFFAGDWTKLGLFLPAGITLLLLWCSGLWMVWVPFANKRRVARVKTAAQSATHATRPLLIFLASLGSAAPALAFEGVVVRADTGAPMAHAEVSILGRPGTVRTDSAGRFTFTPDPPPPFEVLVITAGGTVLRPAVVASIGSGSDVITIRVGAVSHDALTVSGAAPGIDATPAAGTTLVSSGDIATRMPANLMQALENVAGVNQVSEGQSAVPAIRGLARGRTLILLDGARVTSERRVGPSATYLDPFVLDDVEVARGAGAVAYGSDAFGGVISARTRRVSAESPFSVRFTGTLGTGLPERRAGLELSKGVGRGSLLFLAHGRESDDYDSPDGEVFNSGYDDRGLLARGDQLVGPGRLSVAWQSDFGRDIERPRNNSRTVRFYYPIEDSHRLTLGYEAAGVAGFSQVGTTVFLGKYAQITDQDRFPTATTARSIERADVSAKDFHVRAFGDRMLGSARLAVGVDVNGRYGLHALDVIENYDLQGALSRQTVNVSVDSAHRVDAGVYANVEAPVASMVTLSAGVRGDRVTNVNEGGYFGDRSIANGTGSGYVAATAAARGFSVTGQVARGFRDPVLSDRFFRGPSGRGFITGNPDLTPETSLQADLAVRYTAPRYRLAMFVYQYRIDDLIERYQTQTDFFFFRNRGRGSLRGVEFEAQADLGAGTTLTAATQFARGTLQDDDTFLDDVSPASVSVQVRKTLPRRAFVQARAAAFGDDDRPGPSEVRMPGYFLVDAGAGIGLTSRLELRGLVRNMLDQSYLVSPDARAVLAPGVSTSVSAVLRF